MLFRSIHIPVEQSAMTATYKIFNQSLMTIKNFRGSFFRESNQI